MSKNQDNLRRKIGIVLRFPVVALLTILWVVCFWWWMFVIGIIVAFLILILRPIAYPFLYVFKYLTYAFSNSDEEVLSNWEVYNLSNFFEVCQTLFTFGFPVLLKWLFEGIDCDDLT